MLTPPSGNESVTSPHGTYHLQGAKTKALSDLKRPPMLRTPISILSSGKTWQWRCRWQWKLESRRNAAVGVMTMAIAASSIAVLPLRESSSQQQILSLSSRDDSAAAAEEVRG